MGKQVWFPSQWHAFPSGLIFLFLRIGRGRLIGERHSYTVKAADALPGARGYADPPEFAHRPSTVPLRANVFL